MRSFAPIAAVLAVLAAIARADETDPNRDFVDPDVLTLAPFEAAHPHPARTEVHGRLVGAFRSPRAALVRPDGSAVEVEDLDYDEEVRAFRIPLRLAGGKGIYRLEITATSARSLTRSGARIRLFAGVPEGHPDAPLPEDVPADPRLPPAMLEARLFDAVNAHRRALRLDALEWIEPLAAIARTHAAACAEANRMTHRLGEDGSTLADRAERAYGWPKLVYARPPDRPTADEGEPSYVAGVLEARRGLRQVLYRWRRFGAFALPMTSPKMTHAGCGIARANGVLYIVFAYVQVNGSIIENDVRVRLRRAWEAYERAGEPSAVAAALRALAPWRERKVRSEARRRRRDDAAPVAGAAWDVLLLLDEDGARRDMERALERARAALARDPADERARETLAGIAAVTYAPALAAEAEALLAS